MLTDFSNVLTDIQYNMPSRMLERIMQAVQEAQPKRQAAEATSLQVALNKAELAKAESILNQMSAKGRRAAETEVKRHLKAWAYVTGVKTSPAYQKAFDGIPKQRQDSWRKLWRDRLAGRRRYRENRLELRPHGMTVSPGQQLNLVVWGLETGKTGRLALVNAKGQLVKAPGFNRDVKNGNVSVVFPEDLADDEYAMQLSQNIEGSTLITAAKNFPITVKATEDEDDAQATLRAKIHVIPQQEAGVSGCTIGFDVSVDPDVEDVVITVLTPEDKRLPVDLEVGTVCFSAPIVQNDDTIHVIFTVEQGENEPFQIDMPVIVLAKKLEPEKA